MTAPVAALRAHLEALVENRDSDADDIICTAGEMGMLLRLLDRAEAVVQAVDAILVDSIDQLERTQRYAFVMLGVDANGNGPGKSTTPAVREVGKRLAAAKAAREMIAHYRAEGEG